jgi:hypothetical protein
VNCWRLHPGVDPMVYRSTSAYGVGYGDGRDHNYGDGLDGRVSNGFGDGGFMNMCGDGSQRYGSSGSHLPGEFQKEEP